MFTQVGHGTVRRPPWAAWCKVWCACMLNRPLLGGHPPERGPGGGGGTPKRVCVSEIGFRLRAPFIFSPRNIFLMWWGGIGCGWADPQMTPPPPPGIFRKFKTKRGGGTPSPQTPSHLPRPKGPSWEKTKLTIRKIWSVPQALEPFFRAGGLGGPRALHRRAPPSGVSLISQRVCRRFQSTSLHPRRG